ncbi:cation:proton antiporter [Crenobacter sp. SG2303]|uniref:Cation:proton antiporter n=1 Tax=Crenobacter oryzisoli TaxID=3056844 RepID=A0ABT7XSW4_9NEIS|nr:cation:proton antiporter [Crenobacter sp. SG2303]MDN0076887.1 cation:proton antiporter [Crenobacter sp. SG2303]
MSFPWQTLALNPLTAFGLILALGVLGGQIAKRIAHLPSVTGYILTGLIIGPSGLGLIQHDILSEASLFSDLALGLALFELGRRVDLSWLNRERTLLLTSLITSTLLFTGLFGLLLAFKLQYAPAALLAAAGVSSSAPILLEITRETHAEGQVTERLLATAGLNGLFSLVAFGLALSYSHFASAADVESVFLRPSWLVLGSAALGLIAGLVAIRLNAWLSGRQREAQWVLLFAMIALVVGLAEQMAMMPAMALLVFGLATRNLQSGNTLTDPTLLARSSFFFVAFFVASGAQLVPSELVRIWPLALAFVLLRGVLAMLPWSVAARSNGLTSKRGALLGLALTPMGSGTQALMLLAPSTLLSSQSSMLMPATLAVLCILELIGPLTSRFALQQAGETHE